MTIIFENTGFSVDYWSRFTESEFIEHGIQQNVFKHYPGNVRRELLKQVYQIIHDAPRITAQIEVVQPRSGGCGFC
jgi:hypothetical protein